ncbi:RHS repeat domain-containing protein [Candidatus Poribacteria bacterium]
MIKATYLRTSAVFMTILILMIPVCFADTISLRYDANGNLVTGDGLYRKYNSFNRLWKVYNGSAENESNLLIEYIHHPVEERVLIKREYSGGQAIENTSYVSDEFVRVKNTSGIYDSTYVKHEGQWVAEVDPKGNKKYVHADHLGSTSLITDAQGSQVDTTHYTPYGLILDGGQQSRYSYEGQEYDSTIEQYDFHFRGYKAEWSIFTQPDTLIQNLYDPQSLNRYAFERNSPYRYVDPDGHNVYGTIDTTDSFSAIFNDLYAKPRFAGYIMEDADAERIYQERYAPFYVDNPEYGWSGYQRQILRYGDEYVHEVPDEVLDEYEATKARLKREHSLQIIRPVEDFDSNLVFVGTRDSTEIYNIGGNTYIGSSAWSSLWNMAEGNLDATAGQVIRAWRDLWGIDIEKDLK